MVEWMHRWSRGISETLSVRARAPPVTLWTHRSAVFSSGESTFSFQRLSVAIDIYQCDIIGTRLRLINCTEGPVVEKVLLEG